MLRIASRLFAVALALAFPVAAARRARPAAPRIRRPDPGQPKRGLPGRRAVDPRRRRKSELQRIWIAAPSGIGVDSRSLPASLEGGDLFWYSDDHGYRLALRHRSRGRRQPDDHRRRRQRRRDRLRPAGLRHRFDARQHHARRLVHRGDGRFVSFNPISVLSAPRRPAVDRHLRGPRCASGERRRSCSRTGTSRAGEIVFNQVVAAGCAPPVGGPMHRRVGSRMPDRRPTATSGRGTWRSTRRSATRT